MAKADLGVTETWWGFDSLSPLSERRMAYDVSDGGCCESQTDGLPS